MQSIGYTLPAAGDSPAAGQCPQIVEALAAKVTDVSTLPQVALRVIEVGRDPASGAAELTRVVEGDPALSARVLRVVNSAAYALRSEVTNLHQAISYLGFNQIRNLAVTASVSEVFRVDQRIGTYQRSLLWRHLVATGVCARLVARRCRLPNFEDAFLAGLLHDIGIILLDQHLHAEFTRLIEGLSEGCTLVETEQAQLGFDHTVLGERVGERWGFPPQVRAAIRFHHMSQAYRGQAAEVVRCVEVANLLCTLKGISSVGRKLLAGSGAVFGALNFQKEDVLILAADLDRELSLHESVFDL